MTDEEAVDVLYAAASRAVAAEAQVQRVRHLHRPCIAVPVVDGGCGATWHGDAVPPCCLHCAHDWPCPTITAMDNTNREETK